MSYSKDYYAKCAAYAFPFSGHTHGVETFNPMGVRLDAFFIVHETGYLATRPFWNYPRVFSPFWRLYYDLEAGHQVVVPDRHKTVTLGPDKLVLLPDHQMFHTSGTMARPKFWIMFSTPAHFRADQSIPAELKPDAKEVALIHSMIRLLKTKHKKSSHHQQVLHLSLSLLHLLFSRTDLRWEDEHPDELLAIIRFMEEHSAEPLSNADLAHVAKVSVRTLNRLFLTGHHVTPKRFLTQIRIRKAADLLLGSRATIAEIAEQTGFPNRNYFTRIFSQIVGDSPAHFKRTHQTSSSIDTRIWDVQLSDC